MYHVIPGSYENVPTISDRMINWSAPPPMIQFDHILLYNLYEYL
jgi:hypothetical protein